MFSGFRLCCVKARVPSAMGSPRGIARARDASVFSLRNEGVPSCDRLVREGEGNVCVIGKGGMLLPWPSREVGEGRLPRPMTDTFYLL